MGSTLQRVWRARTAAALLAVCAAACGADDEAARQHEPWTPAADGGEKVQPVGLRDERPALCERDRSDRVRDVFCADTQPEIAGLADLQRLLGAVPGDPGSGMTSAFGANAFMTLLGHSTALSGHRVSPLNPRMIVIGDDVFMAFQRGVQKVEVIAEARNPGFFNFYLFEFEQACNREPEGCSAGDLYTPRVERDWLEVSVRDDEDLKNTPDDCRQCHQRGNSSPRLLMRELNNPWTHFFQPLLEPPDQFVGPGVQGHNLLQDYLTAKGDELYGGVAPQSVISIAAFVLESMVGPDQPVLFDAPGIENERFPYDMDSGYPQQPRPSPTWQAAWEAFRRGEQLALPFLEPRATDPDKQAELSAAYARYRAGELSEHELPDLADIFPDDPQLRAQIGLQTEPDVSPEGALIQACGSCHNYVLDQSVSRARFNIDLWSMDQAAIAQAVARIELSVDDPRVMPPREARQLDPTARERLLAYLRSDPLATPPDARLQQAAAMGMAGGRNRRAVTPR